MTDRPELKTTRKWLKDLRPGDVVIERAIFDKDKIIRRARVLSTPVHEGRSVFGPEYTVAVETLDGYDSPRIAGNCKVEVELP